MSSKHFGGEYNHQQSMDCEEGINSQRLRMNNQPSVEIKTEGEARRS